MSKFTAYTVPMCRMNQKAVGHMLRQCSVVKVYCQS